MVSADGHFPPDHWKFRVQGFDWFFKDVEGWVRNDRIVVGVQLRLVGSPDTPSDDIAASAPPETRQGTMAAADTQHGVRDNGAAPAPPHLPASANSSEQDSSHS